MVKPVSVNMVTEQTNTGQSKAKSREPTPTPFFSEVEKESNSAFGQSIDARNRTVNIESLKSFVFQNFPKDCPLRVVLAAEKSILTVPEFLSKMETWGYLLRSV